MLNISTKEFLCFTCIVDMCGIWGCCIVWRVVMENQKVNNMETDRV